MAEGPGRFAVAVAVGLFACSVQAGHGTTSPGTISPEATRADVAQDVVQDVAPDMAPDAASDTASDAASDTPSDTAPHTASHTAPARHRLAVPLHEAVYHASARGIPIEARLALELQGEGLYVYRFRAEPRGLLGFISRGISETSLVMVGDDGGIVPLSYRKRDEFGGRDTDMRFDLAAGQVHVEYRGKSSVSDWEPGIYDLMSLRLVLANDLARGTLRDTYRFIDDRSRIETVEVTVAGRETLSTPLGELETVLLTYRSERKDRRFALWIAPEMDAALVRFEQHEGDKLRGSLEIVEYQRR